MRTHAALLTRLRRESSESGSKRLAAAFIASISRAAAQRAATAPLSAAQSTAVVPNAGQLVIEIAGESPHDATAVTSRRTPPVPRAGAGAAACGGEAGGVSAGAVAVWGAAAAVVVGVARCVVVVALSLAHGAMGGASACPGGASRFAPRMHGRRSAAGTAPPEGPLWRCGRVRKTSVRRRWRTTG